MLIKAEYFLPQLSSEPRVCDFFHLFEDDKGKKTEKIMAEKELDSIKNVWFFFRELLEKFRYVFVFIFLSFS